MSNPDVVGPIPSVLPPEFLSMPLYEYECPECHETKEILVRTPDDTAACPDCGNETMERLLSVPAAPAMSGQSLPMAGGGAAGESCGMPRCCGGGCQM